MRLLKLLSLMFVFVLVGATCGGSDDEGGGDDTTPTTSADNGEGNGEPDPTNPPDTPDTTAPAVGGGGEETPEVTEMGSFTVNGTEFAVNLLNRCIPFSGPDSDDIDLQPIAQGQGAGLNLYGRGGPTDEVSVQGSAIEDLLGTNSYGSDFDEPIESVIDGDRWTGSATIFDTYGSGESAELTWDVLIPDEINDCSL